MDAEGLGRKLPLDLILTSCNWPHLKLADSSQPNMSVLGNISQLELTLVKLHPFLYT